MQAALDGDTEMGVVSIHQGAEINRETITALTALMFAVINMHYETRKLLEYGADVQAKSNQGGTALMAAAMVGDLMMPQALDKGADVHARLRDK
jgi:ankyrin repeat protein